MSTAASATAAAASSPDAAASTTSASAPQLLFGVAAPRPAEAGSAARIPFKPEASVASHGVGLPAASLACLVVLTAAVLLLKRWKPGGRAGGLLGARVRAVEVVESTRLADRMRVSVVRWRGRELLVAHSDQVATVLASHGGPTEPGNPDA